MASHHTPQPETLGNVPTPSASFAIPFEGHELTSVDADGRRFWCIRCGAVRVLAPAIGHRDTWLLPSQSGRAVASMTAPTCLPPADKSAENPAGDTRLMLHALTHGWKCDPILLPRPERTEAWRWSREELLRLYAYSVRGAWKDGPILDGTIRKQLLITTT
jgi:hypothetical protein